MDLTLRDLSFMVDSVDGHSILIVGTRDRAAKDEERMVVNTLSGYEAKELYQFLGEFIRKGEA